MMSRAMCKAVVVAALFACTGSTSSRTPAPSTPSPPVAVSPVVPATDAQPPTAAAAPTRAQRCAPAVATLVGNAKLAPIARDAQDFTPTAAERKAIARSAKEMNVALYEGTEQRQVAAAFDRWIDDGAQLDVRQAVKLGERRLVIVTFALEGAPSLDTGPYLEVAVSEPSGTTWRGITTAFYDPDARVIGSVEGKVVLEKLHAPGRPEVWLLSLDKPTGKRPELEVIKGVARCD